MYVVTSKCPTLSSEVRQPTGLSSMACLSQDLNWIFRVVMQYPFLPDITTGLWCISLCHFNKRCCTSTWNTLYVNICSTHLWSSLWIFFAPWHCCINFRTLQNGYTGFDLETYSIYEAHALIGTLLILTYIALRWSWAPIMFLLIVPFTHNFPGQETITEIPTNSVLRSTNYNHYAYCILAWDHKCPRKLGCHPLLYTMLSLQFSAYISGLKKGEIVILNLRSSLQISVNTYCVNPISVNGY